MEMSPLKPQPKEHKASFLYIPTEPRDTVLKVAVPTVPTLVCCSHWLFTACLLGAPGSVVSLQLMEYSPFPFLAFPFLGVHGGTFTPAAIYAESRGQHQVLPLSPST